MIGSLFVMLPLSLFFILLVAAVAFGDVALRTVPVVPSRSKGQGMPRDWQAAGEAVSALQSMTKDANAGSPLTCCCDSFVPLVTTPEAQAIADELRGRSDGELQLVKNRSLSHGPACPMKTDAGYCACAVARPLACIGRCTVGGDSPEWVAGLGATVSDAFRHHLEAKHVDATTRRLDEALVTLLV